VEIVATSLEPLQRGDINECSVLTALVQPLRREVIDKIRGLFPITRSMLVMDAGSDTPVKATLDPANISSICTCVGDQKGQQTVLFIIANREGYVVRSDLFQDRLRGCPGIQKVVSLVSPRQFVGFLPATAHGLAKLVGLAVCCILADGMDAASY
jgi:hypothetical protein